MAGERILVVDDEAHIVDLAALSRARRFAVEAPPTRAAIARLDEEPSLVVST
jgi:hypothetical protein